MHTTRASLLIRIKDSSDSTAWTDFDAIYRPMLIRFATSRGLDRTAGEEIAQQCLVTISEHIKGFEYDPKKGRFKGWLRTMVGNRVRNHFRDRREKAAESQDFKRDQYRELTPDEAFDKIWLEEHLRHCMHQVRAEEGDAAFLPFQAYALEQRPVDDVCAEFGVTANQLYKLKWRLTQSLSQKMKELCEVPE